MDMSPTPEGHVRLDKWLWCVRAYSTRAEATEACRGGEVKVGGQRAKPAHVVRVGEEVSFRKGGRLRVYRIRDLLDHRVSASLVAGHVEDRSPPGEPSSDTPGGQFGARDPGSGRPTKRELREIRRIMRGDGPDL